MNKELEQEKKYYAYESKIIDGVLNYLSGKPFLEVQQSIALLSKPKVVKIEDEKKGENILQQVKKEGE